MKSYLTTEDKIWRQASRQAAVMCAIADRAPAFTDDSSIAPNLTAPSMVRSCPFAAAAITLHQQQCNCLLCMMRGFRPTIYPAMLLR